MLCCCHHASCHGDCNPNRRILHCNPPFLSLALLGKVVEQYERQGLVARVDGNQDIESVFRNVVSGLKPVQEKEVLDANRLAVEAVCAGDLPAYAEVGVVQYRACFSRSCHERVSVSL